MEGAERSNHYFMNVKDIINTAFGNLDGNVVNFRLIRIVLYLLARQLRILERRVEVTVPIGLMEPSSSSTISVTEIKVHAVTKKETKKGRRRIKLHDDDDDKKGRERKDSRSREGKDSRYVREGKEGRYGKEGKEGRYDREGKEGSDDREAKQGSDGKKSREGKDSRYHSEGKKSRGGRESREGKDGRESSKVKEGKYDKDGRDDKAGAEDRDIKERREGKGGKDGREGREERYGEEGKDDREGKESGKQRRDKEHSISRKGKEDKESSLSHEEKSDLASSAHTSGDDESSLSSSSEESKIKKSKSDIESKASKESKTRKESKRSKDSKLDRTSKMGKDETVSKVSITDQEDNIDKDDKAIKEGKKDRYVIEGKNNREGKQSKKRKEHKEDKEGKRSWASREDKESRESIETKESSSARTESREDKEGKRGKPRKKGKVDSEDKEIKLGKESKQGKVGKEKRPGDKQKRADSYEQPDESPTPMASVEEMGIQHEKLLIVETSEDKSLRGRRTPKTSVVTQEEFMQLAKLVYGLCSRFKIVDSADALLMEELHKQTSYTDAMAALQLSTRLEATEKLLGRMVAAIGTIARVTPGIELDDETRYILESYELTDEMGEKGRRTAHKKASRKLKTKSTNIQPSMDEYGFTAIRSEESVAIKPHESILKQPDADKTEPEGLKLDCVTYMDLESELSKISNEMMKEVTAITSRNIETADRAFEIASGLESKLDSSLDVGPRMMTLENQVASYADQINALDTGLTSQMIYYQEQLTQMQHELEIGLEAMAEALANAQGADTLAVAELNNNFISLQTEQESMTWQQKDLLQSHNQLANDLASLWKQIELLRDTKSDRDEVTDALRDKAGIKDLNGLVSLEQFDAVRGDLEKRIASAYDKFNNQEIIWQKAIDDMLRELSEKADIIQLHGLRDEINKYLTVMKERIKFMSDIVGEPKAAIVSKKLFRDTMCISCSSPATMDFEEPDVPPKLPKFPDRKKTDDEKPDDKDQIKGDGDHKLCYPGLPIPHPRDPRAHICTRYCGGSHTIITGGPPKVPPSTIITPLPREVTTEQGVDGKMYQVEKIPCLPCNVPMKSEEPCLLCNVPMKSEGPPPPPLPVIINKANACEPNENDDIGCPRFPSTTSVPNTETETPPAIDEVF